jgi:hypothetical protein
MMVPDPHGRPGPRLLKSASAARVLGAYLLLPNLLFWFAGRVFETLPRAAVNIDYLLVAVFVPFLRRWQSTLLMVFAVLLDAARCLGPLYYFSQRDAFDAVIFLRQISVSQVVLSGLALVVPAVAMAWLLVTVGGVHPTLRQTTPWLVTLIVFLSAVGVWGGNSSLRFRDQIAGMNLCTSAAISMGKTVASALFRKHDHIEPLPVDSATRRAGWFSGTPKTQNLVLVVVESGGDPTDPAWNAVAEKEWSSPELRRRYRVDQGSVAFTGATVPGEFRELCGVISGVIEKPTDNDAVMRNCLPWQMRDAGLASVYVHGFSPEMFNRQEWISRFGFKQELFHPQLHAMGLPDCGGPFRGTCDPSVAAWIGDQLAADPGHRHFFYWLTLNSHLPVDPDREASNALGCGKASFAIKDDAACNLVALVARVERAVSELAMRPGLPQTEFVIVGDHAPPFIFKKRRQLFSQYEVPYIHLTPRH